jgi:hypothetical protein
MKCKEIKGYENYLVFNDGTVLNSNTDRELKPDRTNRGYYRITVCKNNKVKRYSIHRLVAELFIHNPLSLETVNHIDGDKSNNSVSNLEWLTQQDNQAHAVATDLCPKGSSNGNSKWKEDKIHEVCKLIQSGLTRTPVLEQTGITKSTFDDIRRRKTWKHISINYSW